MPITCSINTCPLQGVNGAHRREEEELPYMGQGSSYMTKQKSKVSFGFNIAKRATSPTTLPLALLTCTERYKGRDGIYSFRKRGVCPLQQPASYFSQSEEHEWTLICRNRNPKKKEKKTLTRPRVTQFGA